MATEPPPMHATWNPETDETLLCVDVRQETHDVKTFTFISPEAKRFAFQAGQYFRFDFPVNNEEESRCYSMSSSPQRQGAVSITVKRVAGGKVSNWLHDRLMPNMQVKAKGPLGSFTRPVQGRKFLLLSGGSGITPVMSMARDFADMAVGADIVFIHAGRSPADLIFRDELAVLARQMKQFRLHFLPETLSHEPSWSGLSGRISADYLKLAVPDIAERIVMCCGPAPFMAAASKIAAELGVPAGNYLEESFDAAAGSEPSALAETPTTQKMFKVDFAKQARSIEVGADQSVLSCAKKAGIRLPSSCANGVCGTCKSKLMSGTVTMQHNGGIRQREIDAGFFLPCCSKPTSDLVIER